MTKDCVIFDIDGTLANIEHRRHWVTSKPKNWKAFNSLMHLDTPNESIINLARMFIGQIPVIVASGREDTYKEITHEWLHKHGIFYTHLLMRKSKDYRRDDIVKEEILEKILKMGYNPTLIFDDRNQVVDMWRRRGYTCCQVAPGDF